MKRKYNTRCWFCNSTDLEPDDRGIRCRKCGATFNSLPNPGQDPITEYRDDVLSDEGGRTVKSPSPSGTLRHRAAKARDAAQTPQATA